MSEKAQSHRKRLELMIPGPMDALRTVLIDLSSSEMVILNSIPSSMLPSSFVEYQLVIMGEPIQQCGTYSLTQLSNLRTLLVINPRPWPDRNREPTDEEEASFTQFTKLLIRRLIDLGFLVIKNQKDAKKFLALDLIPKE